MSKAPRQEDRDTRDHMYGTGSRCDVDQCIFWLTDRGVGEAWGASSFSSYLCNVCHCRRPGSLFYYVHVYVSFFFFIDVLCSIVLSKIFCLTSL